MSVYSELINETGFDPMAPGPVIEPWQPWTLRGAWEIVLGRTDMTVWTMDNAQQLNRLLVEQVETQVLEPLYIGGGGDDEKQ